MKRSIQETSISDSHSNKKMKIEKEELDELDECVILEEDILPEVMEIPFKNLDEGFQKVLKRSIGRVFLEIPEVLEILERNDNKIWTMTKRPLLFNFGNGLRPQIYVAEQVLIQYSKNRKRKTILKVKFCIDDDEY